MSMTRPPADKSSRVARGVTGLVILVTLIITHLQNGGGDSTMSSPKLARNKTIVDEKDTSPKSGKSSPRPAPSSDGAAQRLAALPAQLQTAREQLHTKFEEDYGVYYKDIFLNPDGSSRVRDLIVESSTHSLRDSLQRKILLGLLQGSPPSFTWITGGHSAAAGHGNLIEESQTMVLDRQAKPLAAAVGLSFQARNYAMGGTGSASEIAFCEQSIFGNDLDLVAWDYGMTDGRDATKMLLYFYRAAAVLSTTNHTPVVLGIHMGGRWEKGRRAILEQLGDLGLTALYMDDAVDGAFDKAFPDTFGRSEAEIQQMPRYTRYYKCQGKIESGEPGCGTDKFNNTECASRPYKTSWHPGWKWHALSGNSMALWLGEMLHDAVADLVAAKKSPQELLDALEAKQAQDYETFQKSAIPELLLKILQKDIDENNGQIDPEVIFRAPSLCRTGRLPADARAQGIVTGDGQAHMSPPLQHVALRQDYDHNLMPLVTQGEKPSDCPAERWQLDFKHYFLTHYRLNERHLVLPNGMEKEAYPVARRHGYVAVCLATCSWGKCPPGDVRLVDVFNRSAADLRINGEPVTGSLSLLGDCELLRHAQGYRWEAGIDGVFDLAVSVREPNSFMRFMSTILW